MRLVIIAVFLLSTATYGMEGPLSGIEGISDFNESCPGLKVSKDEYQLVCWGADNARKIMGAKVGENVTAPTPHLDAWGAVDLNVLPDDSTSPMYGYRRVLLDPTTGKQIGIMAIDGYENSEMEVRKKITTRFNAKGKIVSIKVQDL